MLMLVMPIIKKLVIKLPLTGMYRMSGIQSKQGGLKAQIFVTCKLQPEVDFFSFDVF